MSKPLLIITLLGVVAGVLFAAFGVVLVLHGNAEANSTIDILGLTIQTTSVGVACIFIGAAVAILTIRRVLKSFDIFLKK